MEPKKNRDGTEAENTAIPLKETYPDLWNDRAVLNSDLPDKTTRPPLYRKVNTNKVRTFGAYPTVESSRFTDRLYIPRDRLKANIDEYRSMKEYV